MSVDPLCSNQFHTYPRLYVDAPFVPQACVALNVGQAHYLRNVLRKQEGAFLRVFNGRDGEWLALINELEKKKGKITLEACLRVQPQARGDVRLYFSPIRKHRMDMLIEKAVELGVSSLHPVLMHRSVVRKINKDRVRAQIVEACEQCERMDVPVLYDMCSLDDALRRIDLPFYVCIERSDGSRPLRAFKDMERAAFLIGSEGGFDESEVERLFECDGVVAVSLGETILRAETSAFACLSWALLMGEGTVDRDFMS